MKHYSMAIIIMTFLALISASGHAADLRVVGSSDDMKILVDVDTYKVVEGSHHEIVMLTLYRDPQKIQDLPQFGATIAHVYLKCLNVTGSLSKLVFFAGTDLKGSPVASFDYPVVWIPIDPDTDLGIVWKYVCTRGWERDNQ
jgi:hypothetical protein